MHFLNLGHIYETTARVAFSQTDTYPQDADALASLYREAISKIRPYQVGPDGIALSYEDGQWADHCRAEGIFSHILADAGPTDGPTREAWDAVIGDAVAHIHELNPDLGRMVDLLVTDVAVVNSGQDGGGSTNTLPGLVIISPGRGWGAEEYAECLVHEGLHTALFLMDMAYEMFTLPSRELEADDRRALSAVKIGQMRPLDKAFHAAVVAIPLMYMQHRRGVSTLVDLYSGSLRDACASLVKQRQYFAPYGQMLLDEMCAWAETLDFTQVAPSISGPEFAGYRPTVAA